jgi:mannosyltransferase
VGVQGWTAVAVPTALAALLSVIQITGRSLGFDEAATATIAAQHGSALGSAIAHDGGNMSGYYLLMHVLVGALGNGVLVLRLPSAIAMTATVAVTAMIALRLFGARAALAAGVLTAVSLPLVFWAQSARGYALMVAFVTGAFAVLIWLADPPAGPAARLGRSGRTGRFTPTAAPRPARTAGWAAFAILMALATYSSYVAVLVIPAQLLALLPRRRRACLRPFLVSFAAYAFLCAPLFVLAVRRGSGQLFWVPRPTKRIDLMVLEAVTSAGLKPSFHPTLTTVSLMIVTVLVLIAIAAWATSLWWRRENAWGLGVVFAWLAVPLAITFFYSLIAQPLLQSRNVLMSLPPVALALGAWIGHPRAPRLLASILLVGLVAARALQLVPSYGVSPEPWRQATAYVQARARSGDCIAFYPLDARMAFQYYVGAGGSAQARAPRSILPIIPWAVVRPYVERYVALTPAQIARRARGCRRLWFVSSHEGQLDGPAQSLANRARFLVLRARLQRQFGRGSVAQLGYAAVIHIQLLPSRPPARPRRLRGARSSRGN